MARTDIELRRADSIFDEINRLQQQIGQRAYDLFRGRGTPWGDAVADWLNAERQMVWKPDVELRQKDGEIEILAALPGVQAKDVDVQVTPEDVLIKAAVDHEHTSEKGKVHVCEFESGQAFRAIHLPEKIDPASMKAEYRDGMLHLTALVATKMAPRQVAIQTA